VSAVRTLSRAVEFGRTAGEYQQLRTVHGLRAITALRYVRDDHGLTPAQFACETERGHQWSCSGSAYGGDDDSYHGEGRVYCCYCGADGDA
jgi:hypothetical protein